MHLSFFTMIILAYTIPNIYVFLRIYNLFINKGSRLYYVFVYLLLASVYPLSIYFPEKSLPGNILTHISDYLLPFFLYLFLFTLLFDILLLLNLLIRVIPSEKRKSEQFKRISLSFMILFSVVIVIAGAVNFRSIKISEFSIEVPGRSSEINQLKVAFAADFHLDERTNVQFVKRFAKNISEINPDILLFGGDIAEGKNGTEKMLLFEEILSGIRPEFGVYTVLGNHEFYRGHNDGVFFEKAGIKVLHDTVVIFDNSFNLAGRLDAHYRGRKTVENLLEKVNDSLPVILIDHRPTELDKVSRTTADVQFSGHTHNGQLFPLNLILNDMYELSWGYMRKRDTHFFVTSGIRLWGPQVRTTGKSEIMVININFTDADKNPDEMITLY